MFIQLLPAAGITSANGPPTAVQCVASITTVAGASLVDGDRIMLSDGKQTRIFEFDNDGKATDYSLGSLNLGGPNNKILVTFTALTADQVRDALITAINGAGLDLVASSGGAATVTITHNRPGANNIMLSEQVANAGFLVSITTAGSLSGVPLIHDKEEIETLEIWTTGAVAPVSLNLRLWQFTYRSNLWQPLLNGPDALAQPISGNDLRRAEVLPPGLATPDRLFLDVSGTFSSATVFAHLTGKMERRTA